MPELPLHEPRGGLPTARRLRLADAAVHLIWTLYPVSGGKPDTSSVGAWVDLLERSTEPLQGHLQKPEESDVIGRDGSQNVGFRRTTRYHIDGRGRLVLVDAGSPVEHARIRIRYRADLNTQSVFLDTAGQQWVVESISDEDGRRLFLMLELAAYAPPQATESASFTPPTGWTLEESGEPVEVLEVAGHVRSDDAYAEYLGVNFKHANAWTAAAFVTQEYACELPGGEDSKLRFSDDADPAAGLDAGDDWPGVGGIMIGRKVVTQKLPTGATIRITNKQGETQ